MNFKKHTFALIAGFLFLVAAGGVGYLLFTSRGKFEEAKDQLSSAESEFKQLSNGNPYPSPENVDIEKGNLEKLTVYNAELQKFLRAGQIQPEPMERAEFPERLEVMYHDLRDAATNRAVRLPPDFYFGFDAYVDRLPEQEDVPRLTVQAQIVEDLCQILFSNQIYAVESINREIFEKQVAATGGAPVGRGRLSGRGGFSDFMSFDAPTDDLSAAPAEDENGLFSKEHVDILFTALDDSVWKVLDALGSSRLFVVVTSVEIESPGMGEGSTSMSGEGPRASSISFGGPMRSTQRFSDFGESPAPPPRNPGVRGRGGMRAAPGQTAQEIIPPHDERVVAGRDERATVQLGLDVYRFRTDEEEAEVPTEGVDGSNEATP